MTVGQRIAQKRKEQGLSQEGLGEQLGVSRQAIYKWESDASLPEIDKLITLSKLFSVPVGWLLGVEEEPREEAASGELTEAQLQMVQEIVDRYLAARPAPPPPKRKRFAKFCAGLAVIALVVCLFNLFSKLDRVSQDYNNLYWSVNNVSSNVNSQISSITRRVEDILKSQNNLTAEWSAQVASTDLRANTVTFDVRAVPKTYVEGMTAVFQARSGEDTVELPVVPGEDHAFAGQITCPLTDDISLTAVFVTGDKRETQWLESFYSLYTDTFPDLRLDNWLWLDEENGKLPAQLSREQVARRGVQIKHVDGNGNSEWGWTPEPPATLRVGLFRDRELLMWYEPGTATIIQYGPNSMGGREVFYPAWFRPQEVTLEAGHTYTEAAVYTDKYGRQYIYEGHTPIEYNTAKQSASPINSYELSSDPADWEF